jgi:hypothetical protein
LTPSRSSLFNPQGFFTTQLIYPPLHPWWSSIFALHMWFHICALYFKYTFAGQVCLTHVV